MKRDVIHRQAGTLSKSVLEGVMNSIDAAGTRCDITLTQRKLVIEDDGKGFVDRTEIDNFFDTFGYPHEAGDATYGRFRMGRGQLFAIGKNVWVTNHFRMNVDLKPQGDAKADDFQLGYDLQEVPAARSRPGCRIEVELYDPMNPHHLAQTMRDIERAVAWAQVPVTLNGKVVSRQPQTAKWSMETDDAYISLSKTGGLHVYNLGVLVCSIAATQLGTGGVIVSKQKLDVNFARNSVQSTCPVWRRITKTVRDTVTKDIARTGKLDDAGRENLARAIVDGEISIRDGLKQRIITDVTGSHRRLENLSPIGWTTVPITVAPTADHVGDVVMQRKMALVLSQDTLDRFSANTVEELLAALEKAAEADLKNRKVPEWRGGAAQDPVDKFLRGIRRLQPTPMKLFRDSIDDTSIPVDEKDLTRAEAVLLSAIQSANWSSVYSLQEWFRKQNLPTTKPRRVMVGLSDTKAGWTDGKDFVWINRKRLPEIRTEDGRLRMAALLLHEYLHNEPDLETHVHGVEFYRLFHDTAMWTGFLHGAASRMATALKTKSTNVNRKAGVDEPLLETELAAMGTAERAPPEPDDEFLAPIARM